ncbi:MAG: arginine--tRNA ligase, partial [Endomicrobia bacterium]|nr:arginine--tRNA ligase [Endomicrobiia bacterium]
MKEKVKKALSEILVLSGWDIDEFQVDFPPKEIKSDLATNIPLLVAKRYNLPPQQVAEKIISLCKQQFSNFLFSDIQFAPPGFINFIISDELLFEEIRKIIVQKNQYPKTEPKKEKVLIEFVSANPTGPLHIGHGRCAVIGDVLSNIFIKMGYDTTKEYYINDQGRQINILTASIILSITSFQDIVDEEVKIWAENVVKESRYKGEYINDLAKTVVFHFDKIDTNNLPQVKKFVIERIMDEIRISLKKFNVQFDSFINESSLYENNLNDKILQFLKNNNLVENKEGALWFKSGNFGDEKDRVIIKSTGEPTYFFSDIIYHYNKVIRGYTWLINIWGSDHHGYVDRLKAACELMFKLENKSIRMDIILYQLVSIIKAGQRFAMSTREGRFISLDEVIQEVGVDVTRFFLLTKSPNAHLDFDFELAKEHSLKNPVYYIQYVHTRCCGILNEVSQIIKIEDLYNNIEDYIKFFYTYKRYEDVEIELVKKLCFYSD